MAQSNSDATPDEAPHPSDLRTADYLGRRVALLAERWARARARDAGRQESRLTA